MIRLHEHADRCQWVKPNREQGRLCNGIMVHIRKPLRNGEYACFAELEPLIVSKHELPAGDGNVESGFVRKLNYHANKTVAFIHLLHRNFQPFRVYDERRNEVVDRQQEANYRYDGENQGL